MIGQHVTGHSGRVFTAIREIGRGGFGIVYLVEDDEKRQFAMKLLVPVSDAAMRLSFEQEIKSTIGLTHENLLTVVDYGTLAIGKQQGLFAVSEYCKDGDYRRVLSVCPDGHPEIQAVLSDFRQILSGLSVLHTKIIHRDLKPENVLAAGGVLKIGDFGLAKFVDEATRTLTFKGAGTPRYMAPEIWSMQHATLATDLYAVGVMLFEAVTGQAPFVAQDLFALRDAHLYAPAPRAKAINKDVPDFLDGVLKKLLAKDPRERYQTANEVLDALTVVPTSNDPAVADLAARMRRHHDADEARRLEQKRSMESERDAAARNRYKEVEVLALIDEVVAEINAQLPETKIQKVSTHTNREYRFGSRTLVVHFFGQGELFRNPEVPGRMEILKKHHAVHGGYIEIKDSGQDRQGWNLVLVRPPDSMYGQWRIAETQFSALTGRIAPYEPFATEARLFADNLACHWSPAIHIYVLKDKPLERSDILNILQIFIPKS